MGSWTGRRDGLTEGAQLRAGSLTAQAGVSMGSPDFDTACSGALQQIRHVCNISRRFCTGHIA